MELKEMYSKLQDNELLERYENIDTYFEEAKDVMIEELIRRNLKTREEITERFRMIEEKKLKQEKEKAEIALYNEKIKIERKKEFKLKLKSKIKKLTIALVIFAVIISSPFMLIKFSKWQRKRGWEVNNLSYDDIIRQYNDIAEVTVWMASFTDRFDEKVEAEKALKLYQKIWVKNQIEYFDLIVEIVKNNKKKEYMDFIKSRKVYFVEELYNEGLVKERINILHWYDSDKEEPKDVNDIIKNRYYFKNGGLYR